MKKKLFSIAVLSVSVFVTSVQAVQNNKTLSTSMKAQQGPMTLQENFKLAKAYPTPSGWLLANACSGCHGTNGASFNTSIPGIAGMNKSEFIAIMQAYKSEKPSKSTVMTIVAEPLSDKEIEKMADYFSKLKATEWKQKNWNDDVTVPLWGKQNGKKADHAKK